MSPQPICRLCDDVCVECEGTGECWDCEGDGCEFCDHSGDCPCCGGGQFVDEGGVRQ
jgi:hypothetical protein